MLKLIEAPAALPVTLAEAKAFLRVDFSDEDATIERALQAATKALDGPYGLLGRCLSPQTWALTLPAFRGPILLPLPPCQSIESVAYVASDGTTVELDPSAYAVYGLGGDDQASVCPAFGASWPSTRAVPEAVTITFVAGFPQDDGSPPVSTIPEPLREAILMHVGTMFEARESVTTREGMTVAVPHGYDDLVRPYRIWGF